MITLFTEDEYKQIMTQNDVSSKHAYDDTSISLLHVANIGRKFKEAGLTPLFIYNEMEGTFKITSYEKVQKMLH